LISTNLHRMAKPYGMTNYGRQNWNYNGKDNYEDCEVEREDFETSFKKPKSGKASGEDSILSELCKYASDTLKTRVLKFLNEIYLSGTTPAEWNSVLVIPVYIKRSRQLQRDKLPKLMLQDLHKNTKLKI